MVQKIWDTEKGVVASVKNKHLQRVAIRCLLGPEMILGITRWYLNTKLKKDVEKWDFGHAKGGLFCNIKEQLMWEGISPKPKMTLL